MITSDCQLLQVVCINGIKEPLQLKMLNEICKSANLPILHLPAAAYLVSVALYSTSSNAAGKTIATKLMKNYLLKM